MNIEIIHPDSFCQVPWRNGLGSTTELYAEVVDEVADAEVSGTNNAGNRVKAFHYRLSIAPVQRDGDFSDFSGYDRQLILLDGAGITLRHEPGGVDTLSKRFDIARFSGGSVTQATLTAGPITDFNIMTRAGRCHADVTVFDVPGPHHLRVDARRLLLFAPDCAIQISSPQDVATELPRGCLLNTGNATPGDWAIEGGPAICIQVGEETS